jgi:hypothetical protein
VTLRQFLHDLGAVLWGATWGNNMAALEWTALLGIVAWLARHKITSRLAALWDRHHGPLAVKRHRQALAEHEAEKRRGGDDGDQLPADDRLRL